MALCVNDSGTWREIPTLCVNDSGTWRETATGCINQSGTWRCFGFTPTVGGASLGDQLEGGYLICKSGGIGWIAAPGSTEVNRIWNERGDAITLANANAACGDWFIPSCAQLLNPGYSCRTYWDYSLNFYYSNTENFPGGPGAWYVNFNNGYCASGFKVASAASIRAFRCVSY